MNPPPLIDSHAHLTDERLSGEVAEIVARAEAAGVGQIVTVGTDVASSRAAVALAERTPGLYATVGVHPHSAATAEPEGWRELRELAASPKVVGIGETGLDYHYDFAPRATQRDVFARHLEWGRESGLAVVVHGRDADGDLRAMLREAGAGTVGVLHSFAGGRALLEAALEIGWYISFSGMITFRRYEGADLVRAVPEDRILVETDSPYLAPVPYRGRANEPAYVRLVAERAADLRGVSLPEFATATVRNTWTLFRIPTA